VLLGTPLVSLSKLLNAHRIQTPVERSKHQPVQQDDLINVDETCPLCQAQTFPFTLYFLWEWAIGCDVYACPATLISVGALSILLE